MINVNKCPFCGSNAKVIHNTKINRFCVVCQNEECDCNAQIPYCDTVKEAVRQWNRRFYDGFSVPPNFEHCSRCKGKGYKKNYKQFKPGSCSPMEYPCSICNGTGRLPIWYTVKDWETLTKREVPDDMPVWELLESIDFDKIYYFWKMTSYVKYRTKLNKKQKIVACVIATEAGEPPLDLFVNKQTFS